MLTSVILCLHVSAYDCIDLYPFLIYYIVNSLKAVALSSSTHSAVPCYW